MGLSTKEVKQMSKELTIFYVSQSVQDNMIYVEKYDYSEKILPSPIPKERMELLQEEKELSLTHFSQVGKPFPSYIVCLVKNETEVFGEIRRALINALGAEEVLFN